MKIAVIRIRGQVGLDKDVKETFQRLNLNKKFSCAVFEKPTEVDMGMIRKLRNFVAYGEINDETYKQLKEKREEKGKKIFRLHPPRKGIDSKKHFGVNKGVLGDNKDKINELIMRML